MSLASAPDYQLSSPPMSHATSIVFVVDDDVSVRESLELLIKAAGWQPETFASAQAFLARSRPTVMLPRARCDTSETQRAGTAATACRADGHADHLHHRPR